MVTSLARQSVIIKANREDNMLLGNYECAYALGVMSLVSGIPLSDEREDIRVLHQDFLKRLKDYAPKNHQEEQLKKILLRYHPDAETNEEMKELLEWGLKEDRLWQI